MSQQKTQQRPGDESKLLLAVRIRGTVGDNPGTGLTAKSLGMESKFNARLIPVNPNMLGMLRRAKDFVTWGELEPETLEMILTKRAERRGPGPSRLDGDFSKLHFGIENLRDLARGIVSGQVDLQKLWQAGVKPTIRFHPPKGGFKKSTRRPYNSSGELGYRGREINSLAKRMI